MCIRDRPSILLWYCVNNKVHEPFCSYFSSFSFTVKLCSYFFNLLQDDSFFCFQLMQLFSFCSFTVLYYSSELLFIPDSFYTISFDDVLFSVLPFFPECEQRNLQYIFAHRGC